MNRHLFTLCLLLVFSTCYSQSVVLRDTSSVNIDSLLQRVQVLERNQAIIVKNIRVSGSEIKTGAALTGVGVVLAISGSLLYTLSPKSTSTIRSFSVGQILGIGFSTMGLGITMGGVATLAHAGKTMNRL